MNKRLPTLLTLIVLCACTSGIAQISVADSNHVLIEKEEFRHIILVNAEKTYLDSAMALKIRECKELRGVIADKDSIIQIQRNTIGLMQEQMEEQRPAFYDHFIVGYPLGVLTVLAAIWAFK